MSEYKDESIIDQLRKVLRDGIDYLGSVIALLQARVAEYAFSFVVFVFMLIISGILGLAAFIFFNIALGFWLQQLLGSSALSVLVLGTFYGLLSLMLGGIAFRWLKNFKS